MAKKQSKSAAKATAAKPASYKEIIAKVQEAPVEVMCLDIVFHFPFAEQYFLFVLRSPRRPLSYKRNPQRIRNL
jgi:hypothetical protein